MLDAANLAQTSLIARHRELGAKLVPFAGWLMPVQYEGIGAEHLAVRSAVGMFDVSHMGQIETSGPAAGTFLQRLLSNDVERIPEGGAQYSVMCREDGGVRDDLFTYRLGTDRYLTVTNAGNHGKDVAWFRARAEGFDVEVFDRSPSYAMLAVQGPAARDAVLRISGDTLPPRMRTAQLTLADVPALVCGTGYTGEDGVEILVDPAEVTAIWDALLDQGVTPAGLGARDTLRMEVCFHLYGNELTEERDPITAGLAWCCKEETGFIGSAAVERVRREGPDELLAAFTITGSGIARGGNAVLGGGVVTSGTLSPSLGVGIGMAYLPAERATPGAELEIDVRGKRRSATVVEKPIYRRKEA